MYSRVIKDKSTSKWRLCVDGEQSHVLRNYLEVPPDDYNWFPALKRVFREF